MLVIPAGWLLARDVAEILNLTWEPHARLLMTGSGRSLQRWREASDRTRFPKPGGSLGQDRGSAPS